MPSSASVATRGLVLILGSFALVAILSILSACGGSADSSSDAVSEGTDCNEECPVGALKISMKDATGSCEADGSYTQSEEAGDVSGQCSGSGECQVVCMYPECDEGQNLIISEDEFRCETPAADSPCFEVTCSDHGECRIVNDAPECVCEEGFVANGLYCDPEGQPTYDCNDYCEKEMQCFLPLRHTNTADCVADCEANYAQSAINCAEFDQCVEFLVCVLDILP